MYIFQDVFTNDELFSDAFPYKVHDDFLYEVEGNRIQKKLGGENYGVAMNVDEDAAEGATGEGENIQSVEVIDVVDSMSLQGYPSADKKSYIAHIKEYMKSLKEKLGENKPERLPEFEQKAQAFVKKVIADFDNYELYIGGSMFHPDTGKEGMVILMKNRENGSPSFFFFKDGIKMEKF